MFDKLEEKAMVHFFNKFDKNPFLLKLALSQQMVDFDEK